MELCILYVIKKREKKKKKENVYMSNYLTITAFESFKRKKEN